ncbi:MAG: CBS domain-containing protein [Luteolibacter sp.]
MEIQGTVSDILQSKGNQVWTTEPDASVYDAIGLMGEHNIGALVVMEDDAVAGVITERDYSRKVVLRGRTSRESRVSEILSRPAIVVTPDEGIGNCMKIMTDRRIRHLPVIEGNQLVGMISMGDLVRWVIQAQQQTIMQLRGYISGEYPG